MKKILFLFLFPLFSFAQDTIIIKKVFIDPDTVWQVKQITDADNSSLTVFADSNLLYHSLPMTWLTMHGKWLMP
jgi:hypothetical protein